ncbi:TlpA disulfide reductase family protein [Streptomyces sp. NPDC044780]|uniref:TlpA disulfide reductase family protein n=1 Tax=Streptomyces luomodiensis TaxID=3026192 RepID=A0ABY9V0G2_9ACTN|nr:MULTISPECIES: TlpA disulfide reductase family protein [unclassified Streptomyces]WAP57482.1 TlpA disulfide reductase family protein [Streptomyces sp. S465]WNE98051.1 TlpA disulfide reductase family protein [Streptomyces sp. SCA4-21]
MSACRAPRGLATRRRATVLATGAAVAALSLTACSGGGTSGGSADTKFVQGKSGVDTVPEGDRKEALELSGKTLEGKPLEVADYKGKVVVLNVWGSWCAPCRAEAPNLAKVAKDTKAKGVQFVGINTRDSNRAPALSFEKAYGVDYPSLYDPIGKLMLRFPKGSLNPQAIPSTIVLDRQGRIAARALTPLSEERLREMLNPLIAEK